MKRCPQCGRDYNDDSLSFCLDDGAELLFGPAFHADVPSEEPTRKFTPSDTKPAATAVAECFSHRHRE